MRCAADRKVAALLKIFRQFAAHERAGDATRADALAERAVIDPSELRGALAMSHAKDFQMSARRDRALR